MSFAMAAFCMESKLILRNACIAVSSSTSPSDMPSFDYRDDGLGESSDAPSTIPSSTSVSDVPSMVPSDRPSMLPSDVPSLAPSIGVSDSPSDFPSIGFGDRGIATLSDAPSDFPSLAPSIASSDAPSDFPSLAPSIAISDAPSDFPSLAPSVATSDAPSDAPSLAPSVAISDAPSDFPSLAPSTAISEAPSDSPSLVLSAVISDAPSDSPSQVPSTTVSDAPSDLPSMVSSTAVSDAPSGSPVISNDNGFEIEGDFNLDYFYSCSGSVSVEDSNVVEVTVNYEYMLQLNESQTNEDTDVDGLVQSIEQLVLESSMENTCLNNLPTDRRALQGTAMSATASPADYPYRSCGTYCYNMQGAMSYRLDSGDTTGIASVYCSALEAIYELFQSGRITSLPHVSAAVFTTNGESTICNISSSAEPEIGEESSGGSDDGSESGFASAESFLAMGAFGLAAAFVAIGGVVLHKSRTAQQFDMDEEKERKLAIRTLSTDEESGNNNNESCSIQQKDSGSANSEGLLRTWEHSNDSISQITNRSVSWDQAATMGFSDIDLDDDSGYDDDYCLKEDGLTP